MRRVMQKDKKRETRKVLLGGDCLVHLHELLTYGSIDRDLLPEKLHLLIGHHLDVETTNSIGVAQLLHLHLQLLCLILLLLILPLHHPLLLQLLGSFLRLYSQLTHLAISIFLL